MKTRFALLMLVMLLSAVNFPVLSQAGGTALPPDCELPTFDTVVNINSTGGVALDSEFTIALNGVASSYISRAQLMTAQGNLEQAVRDYGGAIETLNQLYNLYNGRAFEYSRLGNISQAIDDYVRAYLLSVRLAGVYHQRGLFNLNLGHETA